MTIGRIPSVEGGIQPTILDAKGDLIVATAADTPARLAVGTNNQVLIADSAQATGLKYANEATATLTAKGDLLSATAANTLARLAVGSNNQVLTADSSTATGLKWASPTTTFVGCSLTRITTDQSINSATDTAVDFNSEVFDTDGFHDNSSNPSRITIPSGKAGKYLFNAHIAISDGGSTTGRRFISFWKNGTRVDYTITEYTPAGSANPFIENSIILDVAAGDYVQVGAFQSSGSSRTLDRTYLNFCCSFLGA